VGGQWPAPCTAFVVKYIAKRAAKNMSSLDSQTIVPTLTMLGRVKEPCDGTFSRAVAEATLGILSGASALAVQTPRLT
jgi:hypothetical protein